ncbi:MAG TPA: aldo/keto reductase [Novosphingobium sp.]|nr:aldo/keto reductase [Novosphingobium sp.]
MEQRFLGRSGLQVSVIGFGTMTFGGGESGGKFAAIGTTDLAQAKRQVALALDHGVTLFDTADNYADGHAESLLGAALGTRRRDVVIATKAFGRTGPSTHDIGLSRRHLVSACEASLRRLGTDWIDLYQVHNHDGLVPMEETLRALDDLVRAGKVRHIGCSNHFAWQLAKAIGLSARHGLESYVSQQILYSLAYRQAEQELLPAALDHGVGTLVYSPLAQGYLSGKFADAGSEGRLLATRQFAGTDTPHARGIVAELARLAASAGPGRTPSQLALAWLIGRPGISAVIVGARSESQLRENLAAATTTLAAAERTALEAASAIAPWYPRTAQRVFHPERNPPID